MPHTEHSMIFHIRGLTVDLGWLVVGLLSLPYIRPALLSLLHFVGFVIDPKWMPVIAAVGAVVVGRVLDWSYRGYRKRKRTQPKSYR